MHTTSLLTPVETNPQIIYIRSQDPCVESDENTSTEEEKCEIERRARERLKRWQARQVAKAFVDNTINRVLENYVVAPPFGEHSREARANDMEDRAVAMAIRNHGLVQPANFIPDPSPRSPERSVNDYWIGEQEVQVHCTCPLSEQSGIEDAAGASTEGFGREETHDCWVGDKGDENNQQQDFLERAVAEAIKKKGLSALSVDYG